jgi:NADH dehydrogenase
MARRKVTVFGGTGFLGQRVVQRLLERDFSVRVAARHPERIAGLFPDVQLDAILADVNDDRSVAAAVAGVENVVNAVSLYAERGPQTFHSVHVEAATRVARLAREAGVGRFIHVSGVGADAESASPYIRSRGKGEKAVREAFPATTLIRPSVMFGRGDAFLIPIARMLRRLPVFPLFGRGQTLLQPAYVEDVAEAIARVMENTQSPMCYELGGPRVYAYRLLLEVIAQHLGRKPLLVPIPFGLWHALASVAEILPEPPITRNQVELMQSDNVTSPGAHGFGDLRISSTSLEDALPAIVGLSGGLFRVPPVP